MAIVAISLFAACGTSNNAAKQKDKVDVATADVAGADADTIDYNTRLRLSFFYQEAAKQQALGNYDAAYELLLHCKQIAPNAAEVYYALSGFDNNINSKEMAIADIRRAAELSPANSTYQEQLAMTYIATKDYSNAVKAYEKLYAANPDRTDVLDILLKLYGEQKKYQKMLHTVDRMEAADGVSEKTVGAKMQIYSKMGFQYRYKEYLTLKKFVNRYPNDLSYQLVMGSWLLEHNDKKGAYNILQKVLKEDPNNASAKLMLADYYRDMKQVSVADDIEMSLLKSQQTPTETKMQILQGYIKDSERQGGDSTKVLQLFDVALAEKQKESDIAELYEAYLTLKKMPQDSIENALKMILDIAPDNKDARIRLIGFLLKKNDDDELINTCKQAIEYNPEEVTFYYFLGFEYYTKKNDDSMALEILQKGVEQAEDSSEPSLVSDMYAMIGDILQSKGQLKEAFAAYDKCLDWKEDNVECLNNYAYFLSENGGNLAKAEQMSYKTIKAEPKNSVFLDTYAWILFNEKRYTEAKIYAEQALANDSTNNYIYFEHAGDIYIMLGEKDKAVELWKKAIDAGGDAKALEKKIKYKKYFAKDE